MTATRTALGRTAHLPRGRARRQPLRRRAAARASRSRRSDGISTRWRRRWASPCSRAPLAVLRRPRPRSISRRTSRRWRRPRRRWGARRRAKVRRTAASCASPRARSSAAKSCPRCSRRSAADHPGIAIELALTNRNEDLSRRDADIAVRMVRPTQSALVARRIGSTRIGLFAHRDYLARFGAPSSLAELAKHRLIGFDRDDRSFRAAGADAAQLSRDSFGFRCDSDLAQLAALRAGVGIGGCQENIARRSPELIARTARPLRLRARDLARHA